MKGIGDEKVYIVTKRKQFTTKMLLKRNTNPNMPRIQQRQREDPRNNQRGGKDGKMRNVNQYDDGAILDQQKDLETFRSLNDEAQALTSERQSSIANDSEREQHSNVDESFEDDLGGNILKNNELKDYISTSLRERERKDLTP